jgi:hypothetical protein
MDSNCIRIPEPRSLISDAILGGISLFNVRTLIPVSEEELYARDVYLCKEKILRKVSLKTLSEGRRGAYIFLLAAVISLEAFMMRSLRS